MNTLQKILITKLILLLPFFTLVAQISFTANNVVPDSDAPFRYGINMGYFPPWQDHELADLAAGNPALKLEGIGVNSVRPALFEYFFEQWGYQAREFAFNHYAELGMPENVGFIGYPSEAHREKKNYCPELPDQQSAVFANLYTPIWDNGENGTPVNDSNYYALYVYKVVQQYKGQVKYFEVWNEPDFDYGGNAWKNANQPGNWWENLPSPCSYALKAPAFSYIRMLRISYEVIKFIDEDLYVCTGGLGYPSFLDVILRFTDNPDGGRVTEEYPHRGGAYFDVLSFHSYPHIDGSLRQWNNDEGQFRYHRHSDGAVAGFVRLKKEFESLLEQYGYDGQTYPEKQWMCTETAVPRKKYGAYIGSEQAQANYIIKSLVAAQQEKLHQYHIYSLSDSKKINEAQSEYDLMGMFYNISNTEPYAHTLTAGGTAYKTTTQLLRGSEYLPAETALLNLPDNIGGGAFRNEKGKTTYVLWAKTYQDQSEQASQKYTFPEELLSDNYYRMEWDYGKTNRIEQTGSKTVVLTGNPSFFRPFPPRYEDKNKHKLPNFYFQSMKVGKLLLPRSATVAINIVHNKHKKVQEILPPTVLQAGSHLIPLDEMNPGVYLVEIFVNGQKSVYQAVAYEK